MTDAIVGLIGVMLIVYLFITILRPDWSWDKLLQKDSVTAVHRFSAGGRPIGEEFPLPYCESETIGDCKYYQRQPETTVAFPSAHGTPNRERGPTR